MSTHNSMAALAAFLLAASIASGQGQPNAAASRHVGLDVLSVIGVPGAPQLTPGGVTLTVHAPAGTLYDIIVETAVAPSDFSFLSPALIGPLTSPPQLGPLVPGPVTTYFFRPGAAGPIPGWPAGATAGPIVSGFTALPGEVAGQIPAGQTSQTLVSNFQLSVGGYASFQALVSDPVGTPGNPGGGIYMSDGQHRQVISPPATLATSGFTYNITQVPSGIVWDMEQGDLDGDGDLDEVYIGTPPGSWTIATINHPAGVASRADSVFTAVGFTAISGEIADLNDDGIMDLVVVGVSPSVFPNLSMEAFLNSDINTNGIPGGAPVQVNWDPAFADFPMSAVDVETGDLNGDGLMDVYVACGSLLCEDSVAQPNRMFFGNITALGVYELNEATANFIANPIDDSRDCEMFDYEGDGDLDLVVANSGGGAGASFGSSVNLIHINNGAGLFATMVVPGTPAESSDVLAVDIDQNGFADLYFGNFAVPEDDLCVYSSIVPDQFLLNSGGTLVDATGLIPDNNWASVDVEAVSLPSGAAQSLGLSRRDYDGDGDVDIFIGLGSGVSFAAPLFPAVNGVNSGIVILINQMVEQGVAPGGVLPDFVVDTTTLQNMEVRDLEFGSWFVPGGGPNIDRWFEKDLGVGSFGFGAWALTKNP